MKEIRFESRGMTIAGWMKGEGVPVISVHGWRDNANTWRPVADLVEGVCWLSLDMPGHGRSGHVRAEETYHFTDYAPVLLDAADHFGWERFHLVGHSMGGSIVMLIAATYPERVLSVTMVDSFGPVTSDIGAVQTLRDAIDSRRARRGRQHRSVPTREILADKMRAGNPFLGDQAVELLLERMSERREDGWAFTYDMGVRDLSPIRFSQAQVGEFLSAIRSPALLFRAAQGAVLRYGKRDELLAECATMRVVDIEGNHHVHLNDPEKVAPVLSAFFREVERG